MFHVKFSAGHLEVPDKGISVHTDTLNEEKKDREKVTVTDRDANIL